MRRAVVSHVGRLAQSAGVPLILVDRWGYLPASMVENLPAAQAALIHRIGKERWEAEVTPRLEQFAPEQRLVPGDGHFGTGANRIIAEVLLKELQGLGVLD